MPADEPDRVPLPPASRAGRRSHVRDPGGLRPPGVRRPGISGDADGRLLPRARGRLRGRRLRQAEGPGRGPGDLWARERSIRSIRWPAPTRSSLRCWSSAAVPEMSFRRGDHEFHLHHVVKTYESQLQIFGEVTVDAAILDDPASAPEIIDRVLRNVVGRKRPGYLEIPRDRVFAQVAPPAGPLALDACWPRPMAVCRCSGRGRQRDRRHARRGPAAHALCRCGHPAPRSDRAGHPPGRAAAAAGGHRRPGQSLVPREPPPVRRRLHRGAGRPGASARCSTSPTACSASAWFAPTWEPVSEPSEFILGADPDRSRRGPGAISPLRRVVDRPGRRGPAGSAPGERSAGAAVSTACQSPLEDSASPRELRRGTACGSPMSSPRSSSSIPRNTASRPTWAIAGSSGWSCAPRSFWPRATTPRWASRSRARWARGLPTGHGGRWRSWATVPSR